MQTWPGTAYPLGATFDGSGTNFALFSEVAERVELCLFDEDGTETRVELDRGRRLRLALLPAAGAARPALRLPRARPVRPRERARAATRTSSCSTRTPRRRSASSTGTSRCSPTRSATRTPATTRTRPAHMMLVASSSTRSSTGPATAPRSIPYNETVIYEAHVKGLTELHPDIPEEQRGTYAGVAHPAVIEHLQKLGVTAIELMPVHQFVQDSTLLDKGLRNYWGYNTIGFFAPHNDYASTGELGQQVQEFKSMVRALHAAGIEVILDVVYNHTAEGNHLGPTLSFRGIDNAAYYRLVDDDKRYYMDYTGTGNSLNVRHPHSLQLIMDSLRYWVTEMHVDGFRFDLAVDPRPRVLRGRPALDLLRARAAGPGGLARSSSSPSRGTSAPAATRSATSRRSGRSGTASTATPCATSGAASRRRSASSPRASPARPTSTRTTAAARSRRSTSSPRTTASRSATSCRTTRSTTTRTARTTTTARSHNRSWNSRRRGRRPTTRRCSRCARRQQRNFLAHAAAQPGRADDPARRRARPHAARQQQHLRAGQRDQLGALGPGRPAARSSSPRRSSRLRTRAPDVPPQPLLRRPPRRSARRASRCPTSCGCGPTAPRWSPRTGTAASARRSACS